MKLCSYEIFSFNDCWNFNTIVCFCDNQFCFFCFYQSKKEWRGLKERHPELFEEALNYEKDDFTWREDGSLEDLINSPIKDKKVKIYKKQNSSPLLVDILNESDDEIVYEKPCLICHL